MGFLKKLFASSEQKKLTDKTVRLTQLVFDFESELAALEGTKKLTNKLLVFVAMPVILGIFTKKEAKNEADKFVQAWGDILKLPASEFNKHWSEVFPIVAPILEEMVGVYAANSGGTALMGSFIRLSDVLRRENGTEVPDSLTLLRLIPFFGEAIQLGKK